MHPGQRSRLRECEYELHEIGALMKVGGVEATEVVEGLNLDRKEASENRRRSISDIGLYTLRGSPS